MCRLLMYLGEPVMLESLLVHPMNSLVRQSREGHGQSAVNGDGFGVAWYAPSVAEPAVFKSVTPAWNNRNLSHLARVTLAECALAHVRAASPGIHVAEGNCHPFVWGRFAFMHNGYVAGFPAVKRALEAELSDEAFRAIEGTTDSEHLFALFIDYWQASKREQPLEAIADALERTVDTTLRVLRDKGITEESQLNLAVSDGKHAAAIRCTTGDPARATTLYWHEGRRYVCENGVCQMVEPNVRSDTVIIASEQLSNDYGWEAVEPNSMVLVDEERHVRLRPLPKP
jgi:glutamine amidotransferase